MAKRSTVTMAATPSKRVLFMSNKTPGNFQGTRDRQEVRALALRAASFARPNRRKKNRRTGGQTTRAASDHGQQIGDTQTRSESLTPPPLPPNPCGLLGSGRSDPFDSMPVPVTADCHSVLSYIRSFTYAINWPDEPEACREGRSLFRAHQVMYTKYFEHAAPLNGLLSYVYNLMAIAQPDKAHLHRQISMQYSVSCFKWLRELIDNLDYSYDQLLLILQTIWPLASAEYSESVRTGNDKCAQHRDALKRLIHLLGGLHTLPMVYRELVVHFFAKIAVVTGTRTEIDPSLWDPGPWNAQWNAQYFTSPPREHDGIPTPLHAQIDECRTLPDILAALRELVAVEEMKREGIWSDEDHLGPIFRWSFLRRIALKMRLWNLWHSPADQIDAWPPPNTARGTLDSSLCLAAQLFIYLSLEAHPIKQPWFAAPTQHAEMLERIKAMDTVLLQRVKDLDPTATIQDSLLDGLANSEFSALTQAQNLLWIVAIGACFEGELRKQQGRNQVSDLTVMPTTNAGSHVRRQKRGQSTGVTTTVPTGWFSARFGLLAKRLGYTRFEHIRGLFKREHVYDGMMMDELLESLFNMGR